MSNFLSPFSAHSSRPPRQLGATARPASPEKLVPDSLSLGSDSDSDSKSDSSQDDDELGDESEEVLNQFPMLNGPQRAAKIPTPSIVSPIASSSTAPSIARGRKKVPLEPGHSSLDWSRLKSSNTDLRGVPRISRYTPSEIALHKKRDDCWMAIAGKVYNVTHYMKFHPGGQGQLMRGAGKDATELYFKVHPWVNHENILGEQCLVGYLIPESSKREEPAPRPTTLSPAKPPASNNLGPSSSSSLPISTSKLEASSTTPLNNTTTTSGPSFQFAVPEIPKRVAVATAASVSSSSHQQTPLLDDKNVFESSSLASSLDEQC
ncbi:hypothetical protein BC829DRAFT_406318 [Chytridium lagenaria]|nr:hypothetical protein BC829DRAFT_406318 [Chytridium lagenaria]